MAKREMLRFNDVRIAETKAALLAHARAQVTFSQFFFSGVRACTHSFVVQACSMSCVSAARIAAAAYA